MNRSFGSRLRLEREQRGVALSEISQQTKIKVSLFDGLERGDLSYWPHGLFGRAYIRAYAQAIHLDPDPVLREFLECPQAIGLGVLQEFIGLPPSLPIFLSPIFLSKIHPPSFEPAPANPGL